MLWKYRSQPIEAPRSQVPDGIRLYAIGDVHGRVDLLDRLLSRIAADRSDHPAAAASYIFLGDYIDRGPASRDVLDRIVALSRTQTTVCLKGNHEHYLSAFLREPAILSDWQNYGGLETLLSYGLTPAIDSDAQEQVRLAAALDACMPLDHRRLLAALRPYFICGDYFFVHAGIRPGIPLSEQTEDDLLWIREDFLIHEGGFGKVIVHGHTPVPQPDVRPNRINIDTGAYATGRLTCLVLQSDGMAFL